MDYHFILKCDKCKWHTEIDQAVQATPCPNCGDINYAHIVTGTQAKLEQFIKDFT